MPLYPATSYTSACQAVEQGSLKWTPSVRHQTVGDLSMLCYLVSVACVGQSLATGDARQLDREVTVCRAVVNRILYPELLCYSKKKLQLLYSRKKLELHMIILQVDLMPPFVSWLIRGLEAFDSKSHPCMSLDVRGVTVCHWPRRQRGTHAHTDAVQ